MYKYVLTCFLFVGAYLSACVGEDFAHFHSRMYEEAVVTSLNAAEDCLVKHQFAESKVHFLTAQQQHGAMTFLNTHLTFRIDIGILITDLLEHPDLFTDKNVYIDRLSALFNNQHL